MGFEKGYGSKYYNFGKNPDIKRWYQNMRVKSAITADVEFRRLGFFCRETGYTPERIVKEANTKEFRDMLMDFVRDLEKKGKSGIYASSFIKTLKSWLKYNGVNPTWNINIKNANLNLKAMNERVPTKEEVARILRVAPPRIKVAVALMAFSGLRPESICNYSGDDGLRIKDLVDFNLEKMEFEKLPAMIVVRPNLSKTRLQYFTFIGTEGAMYIKEYLEMRKRNYEKLTPESAVVNIDSRKYHYHNFLRTELLGFNIKEAIKKIGMNFRPYLLRAYFATGLDIAESKALISHPWRQFIMGHKGDIEARYSTNKRLPPDMIEEMRESYKKCTKYFETTIRETSENDAKLFFEKQLLLAVGYKEDEIERIDLEHISDEDFQKLLRDKIAGAMTNNGNKQRVISLNEVEKYIEQGYEFVASLPNGKAIMKLPF